MRPFAGKSRFMSGIPRTEEIALRAFLLAVMVQRIAREAVEANAKLIELLEVLKKWQDWFWNNDGKCKCPIDETKAAIEKTTS